MSEEQMKIYGRQETAMPEDERAAEEFRRQTENGNLARAHLLGQRVCKRFLDMPVSGPYAAQQWVLLSYLAQSLLEQELPHPLWQDSAKSEFAKALDSADSALSRTIHDSRAFTLYALNENRLCSRSEGAVFAGLCEHSGDAALIACGDRLAQDFTRAVREEIAQVEFV